MQCKAYCVHIVHHSRKSVVYCQSLMSCKHNCLTLSTSHDSHSTSSADAGKCETSISWSPTGEYMYPSALSSINNTRVPVGSGYNLLTPAGKENERGSDYNPQWHTCMCHVWMALTYNMSEFTDHLPVSQEEITYRTRLTRRRRKRRERKISNVNIFHETEVKQQRRE